MRNEFGMADVRAATDRDENVGYQRHVQHLLHDNAADESRHFDVCVGHDAVECGEVGRDGRVLELDRQLQGLHKVFWGIEIYIDWIIQPLEQHLALGGRQIAGHRHVVGIGRRRAEHVFEDVALGNNAAEIRKIDDWPHHRIEIGVLLENRPDMFHPVRLGRDVIARENQCAQKLAAVLDRAYRRRCCSQLVSDTVDLAIDIDPRIARIASRQPELNRAVPSGREGRVELQSGLGRPDRFGPDDGPCRI